MSRRHPVSEGHSPDRLEVSAQFDRVAYANAF